ncbi:LOW QUALITY PROTEIN: probable cytochrome P450 313a4 [Drosophila sulfurigaster albostrigata]|uniref:LOW QUALITY PROTEIN: probable cytochrome P450 313a4 n=1 Tax=Drosophila sulfurigaster albostrigata TaxID=89887 RepID=UPI002D2191A6|nr:LOW QUALITY PROTEIN: probable cytochrome P450 313a4 [Drosophila sulfurigaster albostrigata]
MLTWQLWCTLLCVLWIYFLWSRRRFYRLIFQIPGPLGYPLVGMAHKLFHKEDVLQVLKHYLDKHGQFFFSWLGPMPFLIVKDPKIIQDIFNSPHCVNKGIIYLAIDDANGQGLFSKPEPLWSVHRKLLNPAFGHKLLVSFGPIFNAESASLLKTLEPLVDDGENNLIPLLQSFTLNIATQTTMGTEVKYSEYIRSNKLLEAFHSLLEAATDMCFSPWLLSKTIRQLLGREKQYSKIKSQISDFIRKIIEAKLTKGSQAPPLPEDKNIFLNLATDLMNRGIFTTQDVQNESSTIVFGAFETTANTVAYTLILLAMFPEYQEKAFEEIRTLFPNTGDFEVTYGDTQNMTYMDLILNESMRVLTPVPIVARQTMQDVRLSNGIVLPKGVQIGIDIFHLHRDKNIWGENAETFDPEHFLPHHMQDKHPYSFIPFTKGIRNCIGWRYALLSSKITLAKLLRNYKFSTSFKFEDLDFVEDITLKLRKVPLLEVQKR